ncbi:MAG: phage tail protein [Actinomycetota bacterium]|nr:phage tail protein [Actinomycetota bacterium]
MQRARIERLLPAVVQRTVFPGTPLAAVLSAMEALHARPEAALDDLPAAFDPYRAPDRFVPFLAQWVDLDRLVVFDAAGESTVPTGRGHLRNLVAVAAELSRWRGTARGLVRMLEVATGLAGFVVEEQTTWPDGRPRPYHLRVRAPAEASPYRAFVEHLVRSEKPAYVTAEVVFEETTVAAAEGGETPPEAPPDRPPARASRPRRTNR